MEIANWFNNEITQMDNFKILDTTHIQINDIKTGESIGNLQKKFAFVVLFEDVADLSNCCITLKYKTFYKEEEIIFLSYNMFKNHMKSNFSINF
jgi:hypothetical protein